MLPSIHIPNEAVNGICRHTGLSRRRIQYPRRELFPFQLGDLQPQELADAALLHRHPVEGVGLLHRPPAVGDEDKLGPVADAF